MNFMSTSLTVVAAKLCFSSLCYCQIIAGSTSGIFVNPDGPDASVVSGEGTPAIEWGTPNNNETTSNGLSFEGLTFEATLDERIEVALLTYRNGRTLDGSAIEALDVAIDLDLTLPSGQQITQPFSLGIDSTSNTSNEEASSDSLRLLTPYSGSGIIDQGEVYVFRLFFGEVGEPAVGEAEQVILLEDNQVQIPIEAIACNTIPVSVASSSIIFDDVSGVAGLAATGEGTSELITGTPSGASGAASVYSAIPQEVSGARTELPFVVGRLQYFNGTAATGSSAENATLSVNLGSSLGVFEFALEFILTSNNTNARESADIIELSNPIAPRIVSINDVEHVARLSFTNPSTGGFTNVSRFAVEESQTAEADILIVLTRFLPESRPLEISVSNTNDGSLLLSWPTEVGVSYQLESSSNLDGFPTLEAEITAANTSAVVIRNPVELRRFYRVRRIE